MNKQKGSVLLETILAMGMLAVISLAVLEGVSASNRVALTEESRAEVDQIAKQFLQEFKNGNDIQSFKQKIRETIEYETIVEIDKKSFSPLQKATIHITWKDLRTNKTNILHKTALRLS